MRLYTKEDLIRFRKFANESVKNNDKKGTLDLVSMYNEKFPMVINKSLIKKVSEHLTFLLRKP